MPVIWALPEKSVRSVVASFDQGLLACYAGHMTTKMAGLMAAQGTRGCDREGHHSCPALTYDMPAFVHNGVNCCSLRRKLHRCEWQEAADHLERQLLAVGWGR